MNYYIQGNKKNANKIKVAFEKKGIDTSDWEFINPCDLYFNVGNKIYTIDISIKHIIIGRHDYTYLELPVEHKFKAGEWIAYNENKSCIKPKQIMAVTENKYIISSHESYDCKTLEADWHLWTIADAKKGDILYSPCCKLLWIYKDNNSCYVGNNLNYNEDSIVVNSPICIPFDVVPATKEQCDLLFHKMEESGYEWDADKKELKKIPKHYDISNFHAGMPVLVREYDTCVWQWVQYSHFNGVGLFFAAGKTWRQCIPINDDTKHLLGTTDMCPEEYINW